MISRFIKETKEDHFNLLTWVTMLLSIVSVIILGIELMLHSSQLTEVKTVLVFAVAVMVFVIDRYATLKEYYRVKDEK